MNTQEVLKKIQIMSYNGSKSLGFAVMFVYNDKIQALELKVTNLTDKRSDALRRDLGPKHGLFRRRYVGTYDKWISLKELQEDIDYVEGELNHV